MSFIQRWLFQSFIAVIVSLNSFHAVGSETTQTRVWSCKILHDNMMGIMSTKDKLVSSEWVGGREERGELFEIRMTAYKKLSKDPNKLGKFLLTVEAPRLNYSIFDLGFFVEQRAENRIIEATIWDVIFLDFGVSTTELFLTNLKHTRSSLSVGGTSLFLSKKGAVWQGSISTSRTGQKFNLQSATLQFYCNDWNLGR